MPLSRAKLLDTSFIPALVLTASVLVSVSGCSSGYSTAGKSNTPGEAGVGTDSQAAADKAASTGGEYAALCARYPDVPRVELMADVGGVPVRRYQPQGVTLEVGKAIPADVGNDWVKSHPAEPQTGGKLVIRFNAEPKSMNPIIETSAYQTYIMEYTHDALARRNGETLEYEPKLASKWILEDAVRLAADYPGQVRRIREGSGPPAATLEITAPEIADPKNPPTFKFQTLDASGQPIGNTWVGLYPLELDKMPGAPANGAHLWSDAEGRVEVSGLVPGKYRVNVGAELYGQTTKAEDGTLTVKAATDENPLAAQLKADGKDSLTLQPADYTDVQRETIFTYYLRPEARWADGQPFTASDLEFGLQVIRNPLVDGDSIRVYYADLIECTPLTPQVVRMKYREQYFQAFEFTYGLAMYSPPKHLFERFFREQGLQLTLEPLTAEQEAAQKKVSVHGEAFAKFFNSDPRYSENPLGTGPYQITRWNRQDSITLKRRDDYWDSKERGYLDEIVVKFIPDDTTAFQALRAGEIDFHYRMPAEQYFENLNPLPSWFKDKYVKGEWFSPGYSYVGWNMLKPEFADRRVRVALAMLFNTQEWIAKKMHGGAVPVSGSQYIFGIAYDRDVRPIDYDPEAAKEILEQAGWVDSNGDGVLDRNGRKFTCQILIPSGSKVVEEQMAVLQKEFKQVGIEATIQTLEWASYLERIHNKDFDVCRMSWAQSLESDPYQLWHSSEAGL